MAAVLYLADDEIERECKRMRVFRDRNNPLEVLNDIEVIERYRLPRNVLIRLVELVREDVERPTKRSHSLSTLIQVNIDLSIIHAHRVRSFLRNLIKTYEFFNIHVNQCYEMPNKNKRKIKEIF